MKTASQQNNTIASLEFLKSLSESHLLDVIETHLASRDINPDALEALSNRLGRIAHMKVREYANATRDANPTTQHSPPNLGQPGRPNNQPRDIDRYE